MRNIFIIPTKESVLGFRNNHYIVRFNEPFTQYGNANPHHMYITNDEAIKTGEWCFELHNGETKAPSNSLKFKDNEDNTWWLRKANCNDEAGCKTTKKIVLTTDPFLLFDGIQQISDIFLEWYIDNTLDYIEVKEELINPMGRAVDPMNIFQNQSGCEWKYSIKYSKEKSLADIKCSCMRYEAGCFTANCRSCGLPPKEKITVAPRPPLQRNITQEEIDNLNSRQDEGKFHPYTCCGGNENTPNCKREISYQARIKGVDVPYTSNNEGVLVATLEGWICPCGQYKQEIK